jgi:predicted secreted Zn-dependent protease
MITASFKTLALISLLYASTSAVAKDTSKVAYYPVMGATAPEVYEFIKTKVPRVVGNATFAFTAIATKFDAKALQKGKACRFSRHTTSALYVFNIPQHSRPESLKPKTRQKWFAFTEYLKIHEEGHRTIWRDCFAALDTEMLTLSAPTCRELSLQRDAVFTRIKRECVAKDEAFDVIFRKQVLSDPFVAEALRKKL